MGQVGRVVALSVIGEGDADAVRAEGPVERVRGRGKVCEEGDGVGEGRDFGEGDWRKAVVVECTGIGISSVGGSRQWSDSRKDSRRYRPPTQSKHIPSTQLLIPALQTCLCILSNSYVHSATI